MEVSKTRYTPFTFALFFASFFVLYHCPVKPFHPLPLTLVTTMKPCLSVFLPVWDTGAVYLPMGITEPTDLYLQMGVFGFPMFHRHRGGIIL